MEHGSHCYSTSVHFDGGRFILPCNVADTDKVLRKASDGLQIYAGVAAQGTYRCTSSPTLSKTC